MLNKKFLILILSFCVFSTTSAKDISELLSNIVPGEGVTEAQVDFTDAADGDTTFNILMLRNLNKTNDTNLFTQFSLQTQDVGQNDLRYIGNIGLGYRFLNDDQSKTKLN